MLIEENDSTTSEKRFRTYFDNKLLPLLEAHVIKPIQRGKVPINWTNNNSESANHILKSAISWKARDMPKFIEMFCVIVNGEQIERGRAIKDKGNFKLSNAFRHHLIDIDHWSNISEDQRERRRTKFFSEKGRSNPNMIISTDGTRSYLYTPSTGKKKKLHQGKRKRAEKSTPSAKRALIKPLSLTMNSTFNYSKNAGLVNVAMCFLVSIILYCIIAYLSRHKRFWHCLSSV